MVWCIYCTQNRLSGDGLETLVLNMHFFCLLEVRAMVVAVQQPSAECNTMTMKITKPAHVCSTFPVPVAIFMYLLLAFPVLQIHGTKECYKGRSQATALLKYVIIQYIIQKYRYWWQHCQRDIHISYSMASRLCLQNVYINELIWWPHDNTNSIIKNWCSLNWLEVTF